MRKEILIAIFFGTALGLIVTYGVYTANQAVLNKSSDKPQTTTIPTPALAPPQVLQVSIATPENNIVVVEPEITITGLAQRNVVITIATENNSHFVTTDSEGKFSQTIKLVKGANTILIAASNGTDISDTKTLNLVYSTELQEEEE